MREYIVVYFASQTMSLKSCTKLIMSCVDNKKAVHTLIILLEEV